MINDYYNLTQGDVTLVAVWRIESSNLLPYFFHKNVKSFLICNKLRQKVSRKKNREKLSFFNYF